MKNIISCGRGLLVRHDADPGAPAESKFWCEIDGEGIDPEESLRVRRHSPTGFNAGYGGSGPAQLALGILIHVVGKNKAVVAYQDFKWEFISKPEYLEGDFKFEVDVAGWVEAKLQGRHPGMEFNEFEDRHKLKFDLSQECPNCGSSDYSPILVDGHCIKCITEKLDALVLSSKKVADITDRSTDTHDELRAMFNDPYILNVIQKGK